MNKIACYIFNFNLDTEATAMADDINCPVSIIDSSGVYKKGFISTDAPYYTGIFNKTSELFLKSDYSHALMICSDVKGDIQAVIEKGKLLTENIGVYSPAVLGQGWQHIKPLHYGLRDVPFCEGMIHIVRREIIEKIYPINWKMTRHGYGVDIFTGFIAHNLGYRVVIDDGITVYHPFGTSYDNKEGEMEMRRFIKSKGDDFVAFCKNYVGIQ